MEENPSVWSCPNCGQSLARDGATWRCASGHSFDVAREGYVNLIPGGHRPKNPGDTTPMLQARRRFLAAGHYAPLVQTLVSLVRQVPPGVILDAGCGEGHYIGELAWAFPESQCLATDVAKMAVSMTVRAHPKVACAVADTHHQLPVMDGSVDVIVNVFAPRNAAEFSRVLWPNGRLVVVLPDPGHLQELAAVLPLGIQPEKVTAVKTLLHDHFDVVTQTAVVVPLVLTRTSLADLITMTPNAFHRPGELAAAAPTDVTARFQVLVFQKR